jgi:uncharacterized protein involved in exopolysaccharide biosynthesis
MQGAPGTIDPRFIQTECEVIQSEGILGRVLDRLELNKEWGKKFAGGDRLKTSETMTLLKGRVDVRPVPNTSIIDIRSYSEQPEEAAKVANAMAEAYRDHINSPESAAATARDARAEMIGLPAPASKPVRPDSAASMSNGPWVEILDHAVPGYRPVRPNKPLNIALGVLLGLVLGLLAGAGAWWIGLQAGRKPGANPRS